MQALYRFLRSVRLAVVLLLALTALSLLATLVPQGREAAWYLDNYPPLLARLVTALGYDRFFRSWLFFAPCLLFSLNLAVCTVDRIVVRRRRGARRRYGPDLVHVGLLLLIAGALASGLGRREASFYLGRGDSVELPLGYRLTLLDYVDRRYEDGRPRDWISTVEARRGERLLEASYPIEVNRPLRLGGLKGYQASFRTEHTAWLRDPARGGDSPIPMRDGQYFEWEGGALFFAGIEGGRALFQRWQGHAVVEQFARSASETVGPYTIAELTSRELTGLKAVKDPGFGPALGALALVAAGLALTFIQKRKDKEL